MFAGVDYRRNCRVEGEGFSPSISDTECGVRNRTGFERIRWQPGGFLPVNGTGAIVPWLDGGADMCVDPERPQGIVQVESDQSWECETVGEGFGGHRGILQRLGVLALSSDHVWYKEHTKNQKELWRNSRRKWTMEEATEDEPGPDWHVKYATDDDCVQ